MNVSAVTEVSVPDDSAMNVPDDSAVEDQPKLKLETGTIIDKDGSTKISRDLEIQPSTNTGGAGNPGPAGQAGSPGPAGQEGPVGATGPRGLPG